MEINQGWSITTLQGKLSINAVRVLMRVVEYVQSPLRKQIVFRYLGRVVPHDFGDEIITIPYKYILPERSKDYKSVYNACVELSDINVRLYDEQACKWRVTHLISSAWSDTGTGYVNIKVDKYIIDRILDFTRAFSRYDLETALTLPTAYAARMYMLTCSSAKPVEYKIEDLKKILGCSDRYKLTADFIKRVIDPTEKVLEACSANGYRYELIKEGRQYAKIRLIPVKRQLQTEAQVAARSELTAWTGQDLKLYLMRQCDFTTKELSPHKVLLKAFQTLPAWPDRLSLIVDRARTKSKPKGYIINGIRSEVAEFRGEKQKPIWLKK